MSETFNSHSEEPSLPVSSPLGSLRGHSGVTLLAWWSTEVVNFGALEGNDIGMIGVPAFPFATTFTLVCYDWLRTGGSHWLRTGGCHWLTCPGPTDCFTATTLHSNKNPHIILHTSGNCQLNCIRDKHVPLMSKINHPRGESTNISTRFYPIINIPLLTNHELSM